MIVAILMYVVPVAFAAAIVWPQFRALRVELARARELKKREQELWRSGGIVAGMDLGSEPSRGCVSYFSDGKLVRVEQLEARRSHTPKVAGDRVAALREESPSAASKFKKGGGA